MPTAIECAPARAHVAGRQPSSGSIECATAGSPTQPSPRLVIVMPTCVAAMKRSGSLEIACLTPIAPPVALGDQLVDSRLADRDDRELGSDEEPVARRRAPARPPRRPAMSGDA